MIRKLYHSPSVTTDVVIFTVENQDLKILLIKRSNGPYKNHWALPGGFLFKGESTHKAALRILEDKAGIKNVYVEQLYTFDELKRDPRGHIMSVAYFALTSRWNIKFIKTKNIQSPTFHSIKKLPKLAFDHKKIINYARTRLQSKLEYTNVVFSLLPKCFAFNQLYKVYKAILGNKLDKRNFRKKFLMLGLIKPTKKMLTGTRQRPARLYRFVSKKPAELKKFF